MQEVLGADGEDDLGLAFGGLGEAGEMLGGGLESDVAGEFIVAIEEQEDVAFAQHVADGVEIDFAHAGLGEVRGQMLGERVGFLEGTQLDEDGNGRALCCGEVPGELAEEKGLARAEVAMHEHERRAAGSADGRDDGRERGIGLERDAGGRDVAIVGAMMLRGIDGEVLIESAAILDALDEMAGEDRALIPARGAARRKVLKVCALAAGLADKAVSLVYERVLHERATPIWVDRCRNQMKAVLGVLQAERSAAPKTDI